jgi:hypothetical protein
MNYYLTSQLVADRQAALVADVAHRAAVKTARAARRGSAASVDRPARVRRLFSAARPAHAGA